MKPNFLVVMTDQQRFDTIGALGNPHVHTPNLDRLANEGVSFTRTYCQHPICQPSRASFMTGRYPSAIHVGYNGVDRMPESAEETMWSRLLADAGYHCGLVGKLHLSACQKRREPRVNDGFRYFQWSHTANTHLEPGESDYGDWLREKGYDPKQLSRVETKRLDRDHAPSEEEDNVPPELHLTTWCGDKALEFIEMAQNDPWLLCVNIFDPHTPFDPPWEYFRRFPPQKMPKAYYRETDLAHQEWLSKAGIPFQTPAEDPESFNISTIIACYYAMIELVDEQIGRILKRLEETGQSENTVIIFTSDHGEMLGDHGLLRKGCRFYEGAVRVPHIWYAPSLIRQGIQSEALVELMDIGPTILEFAGLEVPEPMQAKSLKHLLTEESSDDNHRPFVRSEYFSPGSNGTDGIMYRNEKWKLITYHGNEEASAVGELYDLESDPWEFTNLWEDKAYQNIKFELLQKSLEATIESLDPGYPKVSSY